MNTCAFGLRLGSLPAQHLLLDLNITPLYDALLPCLGWPCKTEEIRLKLNLYLFVEIKCTRSGSDALTLSGSFGLQCCRVRMPLWELLPLILLTLTTGVPTLYCTESLDEDGKPHPH